MELGLLQANLALEVFDRAYRLTQNLKHLAHCEKDAELRLLYEETAKNLFKRCAELLTDACPDPTEDMSVVTDHCSDSILGEADLHNQSPTEDRSVVTGHCSDSSWGHGPAQPEPDQGQERATIDVTDDLK